MTEKELISLLSSIEPADQKIQSKITDRWDSLSKPIQGLGEFETIIAKIGAAKKSADIAIAKPVVVVMCADNGVVEEGISQSPMDVTATVAERLAKGLSNVTLMARESNIDVLPVDVGIAKPFCRDGIADKHVCNGTRNFTKEAAMSMEETLDAIAAGINVASDLIQNGCDIVLTGEMGIGNTTTSSALASLLLQISAADVTGPGAGLPSEKIAHKAQVIERGILLHFGDLPENLTNKKIPPLSMLSKVGGLDIAALTGLIIGCAAKRTPVILDGFISCIAALLAVSLNPSVKDYIIGSHQSSEPAFQAIAKQLSIRPVIHAGMHLGEGTGAIMMIPLLRMALQIYQSDETFSRAGITPYTKY